MPPCRGEPCQRLAVQTPDITGKCQEAAMHVSPLTRDYGRFGMFTDRDMVAR
jgi:hypothetical protein